MRAYSRRGWFILFCFWSWGGSWPLGGDKTRIFKLCKQFLTLLKNFPRFSTMYPKVVCLTHRGDPITNTCRRCAERNLLRKLVLEASRQGVHSSCFSRWIHRKYGDFIVRRDLHGGGLGTSLPCVVCRKVLDRMSIQWRAHIGNQWVRSTDPDVPKSKPTHKQSQEWKFSRV